MIPWWNISMGAAASDAVADAVRQRRITCGPLVELFEQRMAALLDVPHAIATSSGSTALTLALMEAGVGPGDEVIVPDRTWIATAHAAHILGATVILADVQQDLPLLSAEAFARAITPRTKAVIPTHLNGRACDMKEIQRIAREHGILVIEDACQALCCKDPQSGHALGTLSHAGCFSFTLAKCITCGQGGLVVTQDAETARRLRLMRTHGTASVIDAHWELPGSNFRMLDVIAALGLSQLDMLEQRLASFSALYARYEDILGSVRGVTLLPVNGQHAVPIYIEVMCEDRAVLVQYLADKGIESRPMYPDLHEAPHFAAANTGSYPHSRRFAQQCLVLPSGPNRTEAELEVISHALRQW